MLHKHVYRHKNTESCTHGKSMGFSTCKRKHTHTRTQTHTNTHNVHTYNRKIAYRNTALLLLFYCVWFNNNNSKTYLQRHTSNLVSN
jgi:hypothetical protein